MCAQVLGDVGDQSHSLLISLAGSGTSTSGRAAAFRWALVGCLGLLLLDTEHGQLFGQLWVQVAVVLFAAGHIFWLVALKRVDVEHSAETATIGSRHALDANVKLATVGGMRVASVVARLVDLGRVRANKAVADLRLVAPVN